VVSHYLEAIYYIRAEREAVRSARLADWLGVSRPTVTAALRRMSRDGMVRLNRKKEIELTAHGEAAAAAVVRRHRIIERWLTDGLGLDWVTADTEAERLETAVSDLVANTLHRALGRPLTCPHGNPIPGESSMEADEVPLAQLRSGERGTITRISEVAQREAPPLLQYLHQRGLRPGALVEVEEVDEVGRTMRLRAGRSLVVSSETAGRLSVLRTRRKAGRASAPAPRPRASSGRASAEATASRRRRPRTR
jgi:DtxR family Mn-dependent transcriptional regulator